jgi:hypothetical protein
LLLPLLDAKKGYSRFGWVFLFLSGLEHLALGLVVVVTGLAGSTPPSTYPPAALNDLSYISRELGIGIMIIAVFSIAITLKSFRRGEKWAWFTILAAVLLFAVLDLPITYAQNEYGGGNAITQLLVFYLVNQGLSVVGLLLSIRTFFPKM